MEINIRQLKIKIRPGYLFNDNMIANIKDPDPSPQGPTARAHGARTHARATGTHARLIPPPFRPDHKTSKSDLS